MRPETERSRPDGNQGGSNEAIDPHPTTYLTELGILTTCPVHRWCGPNLSIVPGTLAVCWEGGHFVGDDEVERLVAA